MGKEKSSIAGGFSVSGSFSAVMVASSSSFAWKLEGDAVKVRSWSEKCSTCPEAVSNGIDWNGDDMRANEALLWVR